MKFLSADEYISNISELVKRQNKRVSNIINLNANQSKAEYSRYITASKRFDELNRYVREDIYPALVSIPNNDRYIFKYIDSGTENNIGEAKYLKIIIINKVTHRDNFLIMTYNLDEIIIKLKLIDNDDDITPAIDKYSIQKFTKGRFRKILFEYLESIIIGDTMSKKSENHSLTSSQEKIRMLHFEIERMQRLSSRNRQILLDAKMNHNRFNNTSESNVKSEKEKVSEPEHNSNN